MPFGGERSLRDSQYPAASKDAAGVFFLLIPQIAVMCVVHLTTSGSSGAFVENTPLCLGISEFQRELVQNLSLNPLHAARTGIPPDIRQHSGHPL